MNTTRPKFEGYLLVRDASGKPKIDGDPRKLPQKIIQMMSDSEFTEAVEKYEMENEHANS